jgi:hypothetical protein
LEAIFVCEKFRAGAIRRDSDGRLAAAIDKATHATRARADCVVVRLTDAATPPSLSLEAKMSAAIEPFAGDVIIMIADDLRLSAGHYVRDKR